VSVDNRVPAYLGRILDEDRDPVGTCFQVTEHVLITAWHVLDGIGRAEIGCVVEVDSLSGGLPAATGTVAAVDALHDLAVLQCEQPLEGSVAGIVGTDSVPKLTAVTITGVSAVTDPNHRYEWMDASGTWQGGTTRDSQVQLGRLEASAVLPGMSGAPVRQARDDLVVGIVSARYNSQDGWLRDSVLIARTEHLADLLTGIAAIEISRRAPDKDPDLRRILDDLESALGRLSRQELERVAAEEDAPFEDLGPDDVEHLIAVALSRSRLLHLMDACVAALNASAWEERLPPKTGDGDVVHPTVVFHTSGERFTVTLPSDLSITDAAKKIVGDYFLRELPPNRRAAYLFQTDFILVNNGQTLRWGTLRDAGVNDRSQLTVISSTQYPFAHDADEVTWYFEADRRHMADAAYRLVSYIRSTVRLRMGKQGLELSGTAGGSNVGGTAVPE
jgi:hypothetical protein